MNIAITGGGTGGHLAIARAFKNALNEKGIEPIYIGSTRGQDKSWFEKEDGFSEVYFLNSQGVVNKKGIKKLASLVDITKSALTCKNIFKKHNIKKVICVGGYSAAPASIATILSNTDLYIHEQNAAIGKLNKLLKPFAKEFFSSYDSNSKITDYPVSQVFFRNSKIVTKLKTIVFLGGSQGSLAINNLAMLLAPKLKEQNIKIIHQTGKNNFESIREFYIKNDINAEVFDFAKDIVQVISKADFAISRAGASTLWELCALCVPTLFIPYPYAAGDHQYFNAKKLADKNLALIKRESEIKNMDILKEIQALDLQDISQKLKNIIQPNGASKIIGCVLEG
jgi:UDP-N-acetylglucosamine--N-acetylmuramyl-(pentapeptide) pyrophosphoryl-undecaprenol N-acetylglucosamine transferase